MLLLQKILLQKDRHKRHIENCAGVPGVIYNFNMKNLISFQDNFNAKGDLPFVSYFYFETTATTDNSFDPEQKKIFVVSYVLIVAFHHVLKLNIIILRRSYAHSLEHQMFCIESALVKKTFLDWFNKKYITQYLEINGFVKM